MLIWSAGIMAFLFAQKETSMIAWALNNGVLNTFAIHARNLIKFLYSNGKGEDHSTDIIIQDYATEVDIDNHLKPISSSFEIVLTKANKQVAHLTKERIEYEKKGKEWNFMEIALEICTSFASIVAYIPSTKMSATLKGKLSKTSMLIPALEVIPVKTQKGEVKGISISLIPNPLRAEH